MKIVILVLLVILLFWYYSKTNCLNLERFTLLNGYKNYKVKSGILPYRHIKDTEFKKPIRNNIKYYTVKKEISPKKMEEILNEIKNEYSMTPQFKQNLNLVKTTQPKVLKEFKLMRDFVLNKISEKVKRFKNPYHPDRDFKFINDNILSYKVDKYKNIEQVEFNIRIYRIYKNKNFVLYGVLLLDLDTMTYYVDQLSLLSTNIEENVVFNTEKEFISTNSGHCLLSKTNCDNSLTNKQINKELVDRNKLIKKDILDRMNRCFYKDSNEKLECISYDKENDVVGVWDQPCSYHEECPFYKKNKNYPNDRGGCKKGFCEMPVNVNLLGFKNKGNNQPICHNCPQRENCTGLHCSMCCNEQELPDFAFHNDYKERQTHIKELNSKGLSVFDIRIV